ncbi:MAG: M50 family metallopeptidase [Propionibacteriaceae bacterium]|nr:M50 family metallopeptidase [Propionibacteriaceae bacterium]
MSGPAEDDFEVVVRPGFALTLALLVLAYTALHAYAGLVGGEPTQFVASLNWAAGVVVLVLLGTTLHELGHVLAAVAVGHRWTKVVLDAAGLGVVIQPRPHGWHRITRSLAGPVVQVLVGLPMLAALTLEGTGGQLSISTGRLSVWWVAGASNLLLAAVNLMPFRGWDGGKVLVGISDLVAGRRS